MKAKRLVIAVLVLAIGFGVLVPAQRTLDASRHAEPGEELLYLPNEKLLNHFTGGMSSVVADLLWLRCIQYTSKHFRGDHKFVWLGEMTDVITRLDPNFVDVYHFGGIFLAGLKSDDDASIRLMQRGFRQNPDAWELPYEISMVYLLNRRDDPNSAELAARYLGLAIATERAPQSVIEIAQGLQRKHNLVDIERQLWADMLENSKDRFMKEMAERKLHELTLRQNVDALNVLVSEYEKQNGKPAAQLEDIVASGMIDRLPTDPLGGRFFLNKDGKVANTTLLDVLVEHRRDILRSQIASFKRQVQRWPVTLDEMVQLKVVPSLPNHPYSDRAWKYNPETGEVE